MFMTKQWNKISKIKDKPNRIRQNKKKPDK